MKKLFVRLAAIGVLVGVVWFGVARSDLFSPARAFAVGDLTIDWGVTAGQPIFTITDFAPGETETREVTIENTASVNRPVGIRGVATVPGAISNVLDIVISVDGTPTYGGTSATGAKTLTQFFTDSAGPAGLPLMTLSPGDTATITISVHFQETAGNAFQAQSVTFDITFGISFDVPAACEAITFSGLPIFGTQRGERIVGTAGNDLIVAFEGGDSVRGMGGDDCIIGGPGGDSLRGGPGNDIIFGNEQGDQLYGEDGNDQLFGGAQGDGLNGGAGDDQLFGGDHSDSLRGGSGNDELFGEAGSDSARGEGGIDRCDAESERTCEL